VRHLVIFSIFLAIPLGIIASNKLQNYYNKYKFPFLKIYKFIILVFLFQLAISLLNSYILTNISIKFFSSSLLIQKNIYRFIGANSNILQACFILLLLNELFNISMQAKLKRIFILTGVSLFSVTVILTLYSIIKQDFGVVNIAYLVIIFGCNLFIIGVGSWFYKNKLKLLIVRNKKRIKAFMILFFVPQIVLFFLTILHLINNINNEFIILISSIYQILLFTSVLFLLKQFMLGYQGIIEVKYSSKKQIDMLLKKFNITEREKEIIAYICEGDSNEQISEKLFLSVLTVKGYIHKIYQKTNVKNRVQLTNIFRS